VLPVLTACASDPFSARFSELCLFPLLVVTVCAVFWWTFGPGEKKKEEREGKQVTAE